MNDFWNDPEWQREGAALDALMAKYSNRSYPPALLKAREARQMAFHRAMQAEIDRLNALPVRKPEPRPPKPAP